MLYVWQATWKSGISGELQDAALMRRVGFSFPEGIDVKGEYWLMGRPTVLVIFEASEIAPVFELSSVWGDVFDTVTTPAVTPEEGLRLGAEIMSRRPA
jgi:hypothetical protein